MFCLNLKKGSGSVLPQEGLAAYRHESWEMQTKVASHCSCLQNKFKDFRGGLSERKTTYKLYLWFLKPLEIRFHKNTVRTWTTYFVFMKNKGITDEKI